MFDSLMDALGYVGSSLDKLGPRPMRGLLAGRPRELASFVPFSDEMGLTDPHDIASGRDVTDRFGMTRKGANDLGSHAVGMLADALIDPAMLAAGAGLARKGVMGLSSAMKPSTMNPVHHLAGLIGDPNAAGRLADLGPMGSLKWGQQNRRGALGLKYDALDTPPPGLARTDPEWANNKTWYHGSGTPGLTADALDPRRSSGANSLGRGIYTAGSPATLESHKAKGFDDAIRKALTQQRDPDWIDALSGRVEAGEFAREPWAAGLSHGRQVGTLDDMVRQLLYKAAGDPTGRRRLLTPDDQALLARVGLGLPRATAYQAQSGFGSILDVDLPNDDLFRALAGSVEQAGHQPLAPTGRIGDAYAASIDRLGPDQTLRVARQSGYDALIGSGRDPHGGGLAQVLVGLDPNDVYGLGRRTPYRRWESFHG